MQRHKTENSNEYFFEMYFQHGFERIPLDKSIKAACTSDKTEFVVPFDRLCNCPAMFAL